MVKLLRSLDRFIEKLQNWILLLTGTAITMMILVNALFRFLKVDWFGSEDLILFVAFWLYFTGSACASREGTQISADMLTLFVKNPAVLRAISVVKDLVSLIMAAVFTGWAVRFVRWQYQLNATSAVYKLPTIISLIPILICFALWTVYLLRDLLRSFTKGEEPREGAEAV